MTARGGGPSDRTPAWRRYLRFWGRDTVRDLDDEMRFHLEARYGEYLAMGYDPAAARAEVDRRFGDAARFRAQCVEIDSQWDRERDVIEHLHTFVADLRYGARQLVRTPSLSIAAILCFALGIGANTSIFSVVDAVLFRPLPFPDADRLVMLGEELPSFGGGNTRKISPPEFTDYQTLNGGAFQSSAIFENASFVLLGSGEPERILGSHVSASLFDVLGARAARGRTFRAGEDDVSAPDVVVLSDALWRRRFASDPAVVGRAVTIDGRTFTVIGVMPPSFSFPLPGLESGVAQLFAPYKLTPDIEPLRGNSYSTSFIARLAPGVTREQAQARAAQVARSLRQRHPDGYGPTHATLARLFSLRELAVGDVKNQLLILLAAVGLVLLIACINVTSLLLARAAARQREISVRRALGASRGRLVQQFVAESLLLVAIGGTLGGAFAAVGAPLLASHAPDALLAGYTISLDLRVLAFTATITIGTALVVSLVPAFQQHEAALAATLRDEGRSASGGIGRQRARRILVVTEIALALVVAIGAALMGKSLFNARNTNPGFDPEHLVTFRLALPDYRYRTSADVHRAEVEMIDRLRALPGVRSASAATAMPMGGAWHIAATLEGMQLSKTPIVMNALVFPGYFESLGIPMRRGESFTGRESHDSPNVAIVNESFVKTYYGGVNPIGKRLKWGGPTSPAPWATIVGVSSDVHDVSLDTPPEPMMYLPVFQQDTGLIINVLRSMSYVVRTEGAPETMFNELRRTIRDFDPTVPIIDLRTAYEALSLSVASRRFNTVLLTSFALLALVLAAVGIYGLMSFTIVQRTREIGIRLAIGATQSNVLALVVGQGARLAMVGAAFGLAGAVALTRVMRSLLFNVSPLDPVAIVSATLLLLGVAVAASYWPARRASRIDPQSAIRAD